MPMLLTRMSTAGTCRMSLAQPSAVERSTGAACSCAFGTARLILSIASATEASLRPLTTTPAPMRARPSAAAWPMPMVEPVTRASLPERSRSIAGSWMGADDGSACQIFSEQVEQADHAELAHALAVAREDYL